MSLFRRRRTAAAIAIVATVSTISLFELVPATGLAVSDAPTLTAASDTGLSSTDGITKAASLVFDVHNTRVLGATEKYQLVRDVTPVGSPTTATQLTDAGADEGPHSYTVQVVDGATVVETSSPAAVLVDRTAPTATAGKPDLQTASDTGSSTTDDITKATTRTYDVTTSAPLGVDERVQLLRAGSVVNTVTGAPSGATAVSDATSGDGTFAMTALVTDVAGNTSAGSAALSVTVDTVALAPVITLTNDTGRSASDRITSTRNQTTNAYGTLNFTFGGEVGAAVTGWTRTINGGAVSNRGAAANGVAGTIPAGGSLAATDAISALASLAPTQGTYVYNAIQTDIAGNASPTGTISVVVDTVSPADPVVTLDPTTDTGPSSTDKVTRWDASAATAGANTALKINVAGEANALSELWRNGAVVAPPASPTPFVQDGTGKAQFSDPGPFPYSGSHGYVSRLTDVAGNEAYGALGTTVDLDNPANPDKLDLLASSDTGTSDADDITNSNTPTFQVSGVEDDATVFLYRCNGAAACTTATRASQGPGILASRVGPGPITAPVTPENSAANTSWRFTITQRDLSGRFSGGQVSAASVEGAGMSVNINVVIDRTPEPTPASPVLVEGRRTGPGASETKTSSVSPTFNVAKGTGRVQLLRDGVVVGTSVGSGDITDPGPLGNGSYQYTTQSVDTAGNVSAPSAPTTVTIENGTGYWLLGQDGGVFAFGKAPFLGSTGAMKLNAPVMSMATTPSKDGYWLLAKDGGVFSFGAAGFYGSTGDKVLNSPILGMVPTPTGKGYWLFAEDGGVFAFGDAGFFGAPASESPPSPIAAMLATTDGKGYWLVTKTGKVYAYGTATALTGVDGITLNFPIVGMAATPSGGGLWLVASDGGVFALGDAVFQGSAGAIKLNQPIIGMLALPDGSGYLLIAKDGGVFTYGGASFLGSTGGMKLNAPIVGIAGL
jgi:hypothetical protein